MGVACPYSSAPGLEYKPLFCNIGDIVCVRVGIGLLPFMSC